NEARQISLRAQAFDGEDEITRDAGVIAGRKFFARDGPRAPLHNDTPTAQARRMRRQPKLEWMKAERNDPCARKGAEVFACSHFAKTNVAARLIDINFCLCRRERAPTRVRPLRRDKIGKFRKRIKKANSSVGREIRRKKTEMKIW